MEAIGIQNAGQNNVSKEITIQTCNRPYQSFVTHHSGLLF